MVSEAPVETTDATHAWISGAGTTFISVCLDACNTHACNARSPDVWKLSSRTPLHPAGLAVRFFAAVSGVRPTIRFVDVAVRFGGVSVVAALLCAVSSC